jgi:DNA repair photolyase
VSLKPEDVNAIVFWSKNYSPLLNKLELIEKTTKNIYFHFTITANKELEFKTPDFQDAIKDYLFIARRYSQEQIIWRYDPICITDKLSFEMHEERFVRCAELLNGHAGKCMISFVHPYTKVLVNMKKYSDHTLKELSPEKKGEYAHRLAEKAEAYKIRLYACCNDFLLSDKIGKASCIDGHHLSAIFHLPIDPRAAAIRKECACSKSMDIGAYNTCAHGCVYCYANTDYNKARETQQLQDVEWNALGLNVSEETVAATSESQQSRAQYK